MNQKKCKRLRQLLRKQGFSSTDKKYGAFVSKFEKVEFAHKPGMLYAVMPVAYLTALLPGCGRFIYQKLKRNF